MRNAQLLYVLGFILILTISCKNQGESVIDKQAETKSMVEPDYEDFDNKVATIRAFFQAHADEDLAAQEAMLADSLKFSPPYYNGNEWLGKDEFLAAIKGYHDNFDNIQFHEGIITAFQGEVGGFYSGSVYPKESAETKANAIRTYGTWTATHTASGQEMGVKFYNLSTFNKDGKIVSLSDYFDLSSLVPKSEDE